MPNILVIQLHRFYFDSNSKTTEVDNTIVAFDKYLTLPEGDSVVHYELIGLITYNGNASRGHYLAYVVDPCNQWWLLNDLPRAHQEPTCDPEQVDASVVYSQKKTAYVFFYRKISDINNDKIINMLRDCYGQNDKVAVALNLPFNKDNPDMNSEECTEIFRQFKSSKIKTLPEFQTFLTTNKLNIHFWRRVVENSTKIKKKVKPTEDNVMSGYKVNFLLHQRVKQPKEYSDNDKFLHKNYAINVTDFLYYYDELVNRSKYFDDIKKPSTKSRTYCDDNEVFDNHDHWIYTRLKKYNNKEITETIINKEITYYKLQTFYSWICNNKLTIFNTPYPRERIYNEETLDCSYQPTMFQYIKGNCSFSIFINTDNLELPHIQNHYILYYSTNCNDIKSEYTFGDLDLIAENLNHAGLDNERYFLLETFPLRSSFHKALLNLIALMNYIVDYEELPLRFPEVPLQRWGGIHKEIFPVTNSNQTDDKKYDIINDVNEKEKVVRDVIDTLLGENDNTIVSQQTSASQIIQVDESNTLNTNSDEELVDLNLTWDVLEQLIPLLKTSGFKSDLINDIKQIYNEWSLLEPVSRDIIDLTQYDDNDNEKENDFKKIKKSKKRKLFM